MCSICQEICKNPTTAACMAHTFCLHCLAAWIRANSSPRCPSCNFPLNRDPDTLRVNTDIAHAISLLRRSEAVSSSIDVARESPILLFRRLFAAIWEYFFEIVHNVFTVYFVQPVNLFISVSGAHLHRACDAVCGMFRTFVGTIDSVAASIATFLLSIPVSVSSLLYTVRINLRAFCRPVVRTPRVHPRRAVPANNRISWRLMVVATLLVILLCCIILNTSPLMLFVRVFENTGLYNPNTVLVKRLTKDTRIRKLSTALFQACHAGDAEAVRLLLADNSAVIVSARDKTVSWVDA